MCEVNVDAVREELKQLRATNEHLRKHVTDLLGELARLDEGQNAPTMVAESDIIK